MKQDERSSDCIRITDSLISAAQLQKEEFEALFREGFDTVINLSGADKTMEWENRFVASQHVSYVHIPVDWLHPQIESFFFFASCMQLFCQEKRRVIVHCVKNYRAALFVYKFRRDILRENGATLLAPSSLVLSEQWQALLDAPCEPLSAEMHRY